MGNFQIVKLRKDLEEYKEYYLHKDLNSDCTYDGEAEDCHQLIERINCTVSNINLKHIKDYELFLLLVAYGLDTANTSLLNLLSENMDCCQIFYEEFIPYHDYFLIEDMDEDDYEIGPDKLLAKNLDPELINRQDLDGNTLLHLAVKSGNFEVIKKLIVDFRNIKLNIHNLEEKTPFYFAIQNPDIDMNIIEYLIDWGACKENSNNCYDLIYFALENNSSGMIKLIIKYQIHEQFSNSKIQTLLNLAFEKLQNIHNNEDTAEDTAEDIDDEFYDDIESLIICLINAHSNLSSYWHLHTAIEYECEEIVEALLKHKKITVNFKSDEGDTPLHMAIKLENKEIIKLLLDRNDINVNLKNNEGNTPLHRAISANNKDLINLLLEVEGIDINIINFNNNTPLHLAFDINNDELINRLITLGADLRKKNSNGDTPLHNAVFMNKMDTVKLLLDHENININAMNSNKKTPLQLAIELPNEKLIEIFLDKFLEKQDKDIAQFNDSTFFEDLDFLIIKFFNQHNQSIDNNIIIKLFLLTGAKSILEDTNVQKYKKIMDDSTYELCKDTILEITFPVRGKQTKKAYTDHISDENFYSAPKKVAEQDYSKYESASSILNDTFNILGAIYDIEDTY